MNLLDILSTSPHLWQQMGIQTLISGFKGLNQKGNQSKGKPIKSQKKNKKK